MSRIHLRWTAGLCLLLGLSGCESETIGFTGVKRIHERITPTEWASFQRIVDRLPERKVPPFPQNQFPGRPDWSNRSVPVSELFTEERQKYEDAWDPAVIKPTFERHKLLLRELRKEKMTPEQFAGLLITCGTALCRSDLPPEIDLNATIDRSRPILESLSHNGASYLILKPEEKHVVTQEALWVFRRIRAEKLRQVPQDNIALANRYRDWISHALPEEYRTNPIHEIRDLQEEQGLPFEELRESGHDEELHWPQAGLVPLIN